MFPIKRHTNYKLRMLLLAAAVQIAGGGLQAQTSAGIKGSVVDEADKPVAHVFVTYQRSSGGEQGTYSAGAVTGTSGEFEFQNLAAGTYLLCARAPRHLLLLDTCEWTLQAPSVAVMAGQTATTRLVLRRGVELRLRMEDRKQLLKAPDRAAPKGFLEAGVWTEDGLFHALQYRSRDDSGHDYSLVVPARQPLRFELLADGIDLEDEKGQAVAAKRFSSEMRLPPGQRRQLKFGAK